ncbi:MAG: hypothetical protein H6617_09930 [Bdellovibrionaceae bacterium]|nr:hypothetical protein [Bdellovibrionales bacterium]MCB9254988.1 hypothetical protein [Pseudobdellovibrionaceae bacterium]
MMTSDRTIRWIENLAEQELLIKSGEKSSIDISTTKDEVLSVETGNFVQDLLHQFEYLVRLFNSRVESDGLQIKLVRGSDSGSGFSLIRNRMKLTLSAPSPGRIQLSCMKIVEDMPPKTTVMFTGVIESEFGTFHDVEWYFLGAKVGAEQVARHYLTEFIQASR